MCYLSMCLEMLIRMLRPLEVLHQPAATSITTKDHHATANMKTANRRGPLAA